MRTYKTSDLAKNTGIHPNTVRLYEKLELISRAERKVNGYRVFTEIHLEQIRLIRIALKVEVLQNGLRRQAIYIIKTAALGDLDHGINLTNDYLTQIDQEQRNALEALTITKQLLANCDQQLEAYFYTRKEMSELLQVSIDTLRNWELNGLFTVKRKKNGYRMYSSEDMKRLKIIRSLRCANYSLSSILRMLNELSFDPRADIKKAIDTPDAEDDIISVCDKLLTSLGQAKDNAQAMLLQLKKMKNII